MTPPADTVILLSRVRSMLLGALVYGLAGVLGAASLHVPNGQAHPTFLPAAPVDTAAQRTASQPAPRPQFGALVQTVLHAASGPTSSPEGFHVPRARLEAQGRFDAVSYEVEADFADDVLLKDARIAYHPVSRLTLGAGRFKVPFSYGELVSSAETDFVQRPRVARQLSVGRRTGADVTYQTQNERVRLHGGIFSGADAPAASDEATEDWLSAARLTWTATTQSVRSVVGLNAAYVQYAETGRARYGADVRLTRGRVFLTTELLAAPNAPAAPDAGAYVTAGYALSDIHLIRARWDYLHVDTAPSANVPTRSESLVGVGYTLRLTDPLRIEVDYLIPPTADAFDRGAVFVNLQVSF